jgi:N-methylhydantoinase A
MRLADFDPDAIKALLGDLRDEAMSFVRTCDADSPILSEFKVYMRYTGQGWEIPIALSEEQALNPDAVTFKARFEEDYEKLFARTVAGMDIEITVWSVNATTPPEDVARVGETAAGETVTGDGVRPVFDAASGTFAEAAIVQRDALEAGQRAVGPTVVVEDETTIIVPKSRDALRQPDGCIDVITNGAKT